MGYQIVIVFFRAIDNVRDDRKIERRVSRPVNAELVIRVPFGDWVTAYPSGIRPIVYTERLAGIGGDA
jgi:hypothetical protein